MKLLALVDGIGVTAVSVAGIVRRAVRVRVGRTRRTWVGRPRRTGRGSGRRVVTGRLAGIGATVRRPVRAGSWRRRVRAQAGVPSVPVLLARRGPRPVPGCVSGPRAIPGPGLRSVCGPRPIVRGRVRRRVAVPGRQFLVGVHLGIGPGRVGGARLVAGGVRGDVVAAGTVRGRQRPVRQTRIVRRWIGVPGARAVPRPVGAGVVGDGVVGAGLVRASVVGDGPVGGRSPVRAASVRFLRPRVGPGAPTRPRGEITDVG